VRGLAQLEPTRSLGALAQRVAEANAAKKTLDDAVLGAPSATLALDDRNLLRAVPMIFRTDDPLSVMTETLLDTAADVVGVGFSVQPDDGMFVVVVIVGERG
jgi:hypothetical protein